MAVAFETFDAPLILLSDDGVVRSYALSLIVQGMAGAASGALAATEANVAYAQVLYALTHDSTIAALVMDLVEGNGAEDDTPDHGVDVELNREPGTGHIAAFHLRLTATYEERLSDPSKRELILDAVNAAITSSTPLPDPAVRETILVALFVVTNGVESATRNPDRAEDDLDTATCWFFDGDQEVYHGNVDQTRYLLDFGIELFAPDSDEGALATRATAMLAAFRAAGRLGGLLLDDVVLDFDPDALHEEFTAPALAIRLTGHVIYDTLPNAPTVLA